MDDGVQLNKVSAPTVDIWRTKYISALRVLLSHRIQSATSCHNAMATIDDIIYNPRPSGSLWTMYNELPNPDPLRATTSPLHTCCPSPCYTAYLRGPTGTPHIVTMWRVRLRQTDTHTHGSRFNTTKVLISHMVSLQVIIKLAHALALAQL